MKLSEILIFFGFELERFLYKSAILVVKFRFFSHIHSDFISDQSGRSA